MSFVGEFLLPLVKGGTVHVGRPLGPAAVDAVVAAQGAIRRAASAGPLGPALVTEQDAVAELARHRHARARALLWHVPAPPLDAASVRLGVAVHNLLALGHPGLGGPGHERRQRRIAEVTTPIADLGPPATAEEAVRRHSLLARLGEVTRTEHTVDFWLGRRQFVGQAPPPGLLVLPRLRRVSTTSVRRVWFREVGVPLPGADLLAALLRASPLGEALDPLRLEPPLAWERVLPVLRFPALCRVAAGRLVDIGVEAAGGAVAGALHRFAATRDAGGDAARDALAFGVRFLAHALWLHHLFGSDDIAASSELGVLVAAAASVDERLVWPPDLRRGGDSRRALAPHLERLCAEAPVRAPDRHAAAVALCRFATAPAGAPAIVAPA